MKRHHRVTSAPLKRSASACLLSAVLPGAPARADPGLGSLEGLWIVYLVGLVAVLLAALIFAVLAYIGIKWLRGTNPGRARLGRVIIILLGVVVLVVSTQFTDYSLYLLRNNSHADATTITRAHVERYMETDDGRAFYLVKTGLPYFKPGRAVVIRTNASGQSRVFDIFEASRSMYHRQSEKKLWIPIIPTIRERFPLQDRGPVVLLDLGWHYDDLRIAVESAPIPWCCDANWVRLLLDRGANPNEPTGGALPLYQAVNPIGWHHSEDDIAAIEAGLSELLAAGVDVNATNDKGDTALHHLANFPHARSIAWVLEHGADPSQKNANGKTPIDLMLEERNRFGRYWNSKALSEHSAMVDMMSRSAAP